MKRMIRTAWHTSWSLWRPIWLIYIIQFALAFGLGMQIWQVMEESIGDSLRINMLDGGFNRTVFEDFLKVHGASVTPLLGLARWIIPVYMLLSILLHTGLVYCIVNTDYSLTGFLSGGIKYYWKSLLLIIPSHFLIILWTLLVWGGYFLLIGNPIENFATEVPFVWSIIILAIPFLIGIYILWAFSLCARFLMVAEKNKGRKYYRRGIKTTLHKLWKLIGWYLLQNIILVLILILYQWLKEMIPCDTYFFLILLIIIQQSANWIRVWLRSFYYSGFGHLVMTQYGK